MSDQAAMSDQVASFDGARLIRFAEALNSTVEELRALPLGALGVKELQAIVVRTLEEADTVIPSLLLPELHSLVAPIREAETERDLRVLLVELDGWVRGLLGGMGITFAAAPTPDEES
jgi:hypothetical protein